MAPRGGKKHSPVAHHHHHAITPRPLRRGISSIKKKSLFSPLGATSPSGIFVFVGLFEDCVGHRGDRLHNGGGLLPAIIQDERTVAFDLGFMNPNSCDDATNGELVFFSRARNKLWRRVESIGHSAGREMPRGIATRMLPARAGVEAVRAGSLSRRYPGCFSGDSSLTARCGLRRAQRLRQRRFRSEKTR